MPKKTKAKSKKVTKKVVKKTKTKKVVKKTKTKKVVKKTKVEKKLKVDPKQTQQIKSNQQNDEIEIKKIKKQETEKRLYKVKDYFI